MFSKSLFCLLLCFGFRLQNVEAIPPGRFDVITRPVSRVFTIIHDYVYPPAPAIVPSCGCMQAEVHPDPHRFNQPKPATEDELTPPRSLFGKPMHYKDLFNALSNNLETIPENEEVTLHKSSEVNQVESPSFLPGVLTGTYYQSFDEVYYSQLPTNEQNNNNAGKLAEATTDSPINNWNDALKKINEFNEAFPELQQTNVTPSLGKETSENQPIENWKPVQEIDITNSNSSKFLPFNEDAVQISPELLNSVNNLYLGLSNAVEGNSSLAENVTEKVEVLMFGTESLKDDNQTVANYPVSNAVPLNDSLILENVNTNPQNISYKGADIIQTDQEPIDELLKNKTKTSLNILGNETVDDAHLNLESPNIVLDEISHLEIDNNNTLSKDGIDSMNNNNIFLIGSNENSTIERVIFKPFNKISGVERMLNIIHNQFDDSPINTLEIFNNSSNETQAINLTETPHDLSNLTINDNLLSEVFKTTNDSTNEFQNVSVTNQFQNNLNETNLNSSSIIDFKNESFSTDNIIEQSTKHSDTPNLVHMNESLHSSDEGFGNATESTILVTDGTNIEVPLANNKTRLPENDDYIEEYMEDLDDDALDYIWLAKNFDKKLLTRLGSNSLNNTFIPLLNDSVTTEELLDLTPETKDPIKTVRFDPVVVIIPENITTNNSMDEEDNMVHLKGILKNKVNSSSIFNNSDLEIHKTTIENFDIPLIKLTPPNTDESLDISEYDDDSLENEENVGSSDTFWNISGNDTNIIEDDIVSGGNESKLNEQDLPASDANIENNSSIGKDLLSSTIMKETNYNFSDSTINQTLDAIVDFEKVSSLDLNLTSNEGSNDTSDFINSTIIKETYNNVSDSTPNQPLDAIVDIGKVSVLDTNLTTIENLNDTSDVLNSTIIKETNNNVSDSTPNQPLDAIVDFGKVSELDTNLTTIENLNDTSDVLNSTIIKETNKNVSDSTPNQPLGAIVDFGKASVLDSNLTSTENLNDTSDVLNSTIIKETNNNVSDSTPNQPLDAIVDFGKVSELDTNLTTIENLNDTSDVLNSTIIKETNNNVSDSTNNQPLDVIVDFEKVSELDSNLASNESLNEIGDPVNVIPLNEESPLGENIDEMEPVSKVDMSQYVPKPILINDGKNLDSPVIHTG